jgi:hypothetical protein
MNISLTAPILRDFTIERLTAQTVIQCEDPTFLPLAKNQTVDVLFLSERLAWVVDDEASEGWAPLAKSKLEPVLAPHLGTDIVFRLTVTARQQTQHLVYYKNLESYICTDSLEFTGLIWEDHIFLTLECNNKVISTVKAYLSDFKEAQQKTIKLEFKHFKRTSATLVLQITHKKEEKKGLVMEKAENKGSKMLVPGEIRRYSCKASAVCGEVHQSGHLIITNYRFLFSSGSKYDPILSVPHFSISSLLINLGQLSLTTKDLRTIVYFISQSIMRFVLDKYSELIGLYFCYDYHLAFGIGEKFGWEVFNTLREFTRMGAVDTGLYSQTSINKEFSLCETYPAMLFFPVSVTETELFEIAAGRNKGRLPALTWTSGSAALFRSSQRTSSESCAEDLSFIEKAGIQYIIDLTSKEIENCEQNSPVCVVFKSLADRYKIKKSYQAMKGITEKEDFLLQIYNGKWLRYVSSVINTAKIVADLVGRKKNSVLVQGAEGWDRTAEISSLAQIFLDPFYRTFHGFQVLVCKDWLSFGHRFKDRTSEDMPIFLMFLDCVFQIMRQNRNEFQFTNEYLLFLAEAAFSGMYGTFMGNCEKDEMELRGKTVSVWGEEREVFFNLEYETVLYDGLEIRTEMARLAIWDFFYKWHV